MSGDTPHCPGVHLHAVRGIRTRERERERGRTRERERQSERGGGGPSSGAEGEVDIPRESFVPGIITPFPGTRWT